MLLWRPPGRRTGQTDGMSFPHFTMPSQWLRQRRPGVCTVAPVRIGLAIGTGSSRALLSLLDWACRPANADRVEVACSYQQSSVRPRLSLMRIAHKRRPPGS